MKRLLYTAGLVCLSSLSSQAADVYISPSTPVVNGAAVSATNPLPISGSFSATLTGFAPASVYATLAVTAASARVVLPAGTTVVVYNTGANVAYVQLGGVGVTATTTNDAVPAGGWMAFSVGANTNLAAITAASTTNLNISGGSGLPTGSGGGSGGGGGGGSVTQGTVPWVVDGSGVTQPISASALPLPSGAATSAAQTTGNTSLSTIATNTTGVATAANQSTGNTSLSTIATNTTNAATTTNQTSVQSAPGTPQTVAVTVQGNASGVAVPVSAASLPLPTGAATSALQPTNAAQASTTSGQTGHLAQGAVTTSAPTYTTGQTNPLSLDTGGSLRTTVTNSNPNGSAVSASSSPVVIASDQAAIPIKGVTASGASLTENPLADGGKAQSSETAVTNGQKVNLLLDLVGKMVTSPYANRENFLNCAVTDNANTATTCTGMGAQGGSVKIYITNLCITRSDAGTTAISATLNDSATTVYDIPNSGGGGGICPPLTVPLQVAANTAFQVTMSSATTSVHISASGFKGY